MKLYDWQKSGAPLSYVHHCEAMLAALPGFPYMLDEADQAEEAVAVTRCAERTDSEADWAIVAIQDGNDEFAGEWEHSGRP